MIKIENNKILKILSNLFLNEFKQIQCDLDIDLYVYHYEKFSSLNTQCIDIYPDHVYENILTNILKLDFDYSFLLENKICTIETKLLCILFYIDKKMLLQAILRIVFNKEKVKYLKQCPKDYEYKFLHMIVSNVVKFYFKKHGNDFKCLFRTDEIYFEDLLKHAFLIFGNEFLYESYTHNLIEDKSILNDDEEKEIIKFLGFFSNFSMQLMNYMPDIIKILLRLIWDEVNLYFTIPKENYYPLFMVLFFKFYCSPKYQQIYNFETNRKVLMLNKVLMNIASCTLFDENDRLADYNQIIYSCNQKLKVILKETVFATSDSDIKNLLSKGLLNIELPQFLFYYDCSYISSIFRNLDEFNIYKGNNFYLVLENDINFLC